MANADNLLASVVSEAAETLKESYRETGYINTGNSLESIVPRDNTIVGNVSVETLLHGRRPSKKFPPWGYERNSEIPTSLMQWCMDIFGETAKEARGTSFVIARSLKQEGNRVYRGLVSPIPSDPTIDKANEAMFEKVNNRVELNITFHGL